MPYSLIHCKTIRTGIHKGNPLMPLGKQIGMQLLFGCSFSCLPQGGYRGPNWKGPLVFFPPFLSRQKGCARAARAQKDFILLKRGNGLPRTLLTLAVPKSCYSLGARTTFDRGARNVTRNDRGVRIAARPMYLQLQNLSIALNFSPLN